MIEHCSFQHVNYYHVNEKKEGRVKILVGCVFLIGTPCSYLVRAVANISEKIQA